MLKIKSEKNIKFFDYTLFSIITGTIIISLIILYSVTSLTMPINFYKQLLWSFLGFILMLTIIFIDLEKLREYIPIVTLFTLILLLITLFMPKIQHVRRWIPLGFMNLQTSELAKISIILFISDYCDRNFSKIGNFKFLIKPLIIISIILILIALEPDLGTPVLIFGVSILIFYTAGSKLKFLLLPVLFSLPLIIIELFRHPYRIARLKTFLSPWENASNATYQLSQSLIAIGRGGIFGVGPGSSTMKLKYLPESHTDFIFPIIAEEFGFIGTLFLFSFFITFLYKSIQIAKNTNSYFLSLLTLGSIFMITFQAIFNIAMTTGMIPTKGLPLPFFSYGGTSILTSFIFSGFILNVSMRRKKI